MRVGLALVGVIAMTACGDRGDQDQRAVESTPLVDGAKGADDCPEATRLDVHPTAAAASQLESVWRTVHAYAETNLAEFGTDGISWTDDSRGVVYASFVGDLPSHREQVTQLVGSTDRVKICRAEMTSADAQKLQSALSDELGTKFNAIAVTPSARVKVSLKESELALATELDRRFGSSIELEVGVLRFPIQVAEEACYRLSPAIARPDLVTAPHRVAASGASDGYALTLTNEGQSAISLVTGETVGYLLDDAGRVVNAYPEPTYAVGIPLGIDAYSSAELPVHVSLASCRGELGYTVPAGQYTLVVEVFASVEGESVLLQSEPLAITIP